MRRVNKSQRVSAYSAENPPAIHVGMGETFIMETNDRFQGYTSPDDAPLDLLMSMTGPVYVGRHTAGRYVVSRGARHYPEHGLWLDRGHSGAGDVEESRRPNGVGGKCKSRGTASGSTTGSRSPMPR